MGHAYCACHRPSMCMNGRVRCTESASPIREGCCPNLLHGYCPCTAKAEGQGREVARIACHETERGNASWSLLIQYKEVLPPYTMRPGSHTAGGRDVVHVVHHETGVGEWTDHAWHASASPMHPAPNGAVSSTGISSIEATLSEPPSMSIASHPKLRRVQLRPSKELAPPQAPPAEGSAQ